MLTRLGGQPMAVNPDLIEKAEATPDTVITLVDGHKFVVAESVAEVVDRVRAWRASVAAEAFSMSEPAPSAGRVADARQAPGSQDDEAATSGSGAASGSAAGGSGAALARVLHMPAREE
jgi:flagellar protein FlbD